MERPVALFAVYDKEGVEDFAEQLISMGWSILASKGTYDYLKDKLNPTRDVIRNVADFVGKPILGHRVVTLSREIHAALLAQDTPEDNAELKELGIPRIDLVYVGIYPLEQEIANPGRTLHSVIEKTDIGGPTMLRSAAKGRRIVITSPSGMQAIINILKTTPLDEILANDRLISSWVADAERLVGEYCLASSQYHRSFTGDMRTIWEKR